MSKRKILAFPHHDPSGKYNKTLEKNIDFLREIFTEILVSVTAQTATDNPKVLALFREKGVSVYRNPKNSNIGDHQRNIFRLKKFANDDLVYFGFIDRILFALETKYRASFINDIQKNNHNGLTIYSRSDSAWRTHPRDYFEIESLANQAGKVFTGYNIDWAWCGAILNKDIITDILQESTAPDLSVFAEIVMIAIKNKRKIKNKKVDWLAWEDRFWARKNKEKMSKNLSKENKNFRMKYCLKMMERFLG